MIISPGRKDSVRALERSKAQSLEVRYSRRICSRYYHRRPVRRNAGSKSHAPVEPVQWECDAALDRRKIRRATASRSDTSKGFTRQNTFVASTNARTAGSDTLESTSTVLRTNS